MGASPATAYQIVNWRKIPITLVDLVTSRVLSAIAVLTQ